MEARTLCDDARCRRRRVLLQQNLLVVFDRARHGLVPTEWWLSDLFARRVQQGCPAVTSSTIRLLPERSGTTFTVKASRAGRAGAEREQAAEEEQAVELGPVVPQAKCKGRACLQAQDNQSSV